MEQTLEQKLKNVKTRIMKDLEQNDLEESKYHEIMKQYLREEKVTNNETSIMTNIEITSLISSSKPIISQYGLKNDYISLENKELPTEITEDIKKYNKLKIQLTNYLDETIKPNEKTINQFIDIINSYINTNINSINENRRCIISNRMSFDFIGKIKYQFKKEEEKLPIGEYTFSELYNVINKI
jgi:hypothetical protein